MTDPPGRPAADRSTRPPGSPGGPAPADAPDPGRERPLDPADIPARAQLAREALAAAKADARARGSRPGVPAARGAGAAAAGQARPGRRRRDEPQPLLAAIDGLIGDSGWELAAATGSVFARWAQIVGPELAAHTRPEHLAGGELTIAADSTAWATQVRLLAAQLVARLNAELGDGAVARVKVRGPVNAQRRPGQWRVPGSRGPRDTYG